MTNYLSHALKAYWEVTDYSRKIHRFFYGHAYDGGIPDSGSHRYAHDAPYCDRSAHVLSNSLNYLEAFFSSRAHSFFLDFRVTDDCNVPHYCDLYYRT